jgi:predicted RNA-binding protein Jag
MEQLEKIATVPLNDLKKLQKLFLTNRSENKNLSLVINVSDYKDSTRENLRVNCKYYVKNVFFKNFKTKTRLFIFLF